MKIYKYKGELLSLAFKLKHILIIALLSLIVQNIKAQSDISLELAKIRENFLKSEQIMVQMDYNLYDGENDGKLLESSPAIVYKNNEYQVLEFMGNQSWYLKDETIVVSANDKKVILGNPVNTGIAGISTLQLDTLLTLYQAKKIQTKNGYYYKINIPDNYNSPYRSMDIYPSKNGLYKKLVLYSKLPLSYYGICSECNDKFPRLEIEFKYKKNGFIMPDKNTILSLIKNKDNNYTLTGKYSNYQLVNLKYNN